MNFVEIFKTLSEAKNIAKTLLNPFLRKRAELLHNIVLSEIRQGNFSSVNEDDLIAISYRLMRDATEGVAKNNLRLMARLICGLNDAHQLTAQNFQKYAKTLADLEPEEIQIIANVVKKYQSLPSKDSEEYDIAKHRIIDSVLYDMHGNHPPKNQQKYSETYVRFNMLERTGFFISRGSRMSSYKDGQYGSPFSITPFFEQFITFCPNWLDLATWDENNV